MHEFVSFSNRFIFNTFHTELEIRNERIRLTHEMRSC